MSLPADEHSIHIEPCGAVYIDIAKVASSSIKATLAAYLDVGRADGNPHEIGLPRPRRIDPLGERLFPGLYAFAFVRNPWDRLVSCYRDKIRGEVSGFTEFAESGVAHCLARFDAFSPAMSFEDFVRAVASIPDQEADEHFRSQSDFVTNASGVVAVDFIGRFETLDRDFASVARRIGFPADIQLPHLQAAPRRPYRAFFNPESRKIVEERFARDIELFHYEFSVDQG